MAKRIKIVGSAIRVEDTVLGKIELDEPSKYMWYDSNKLDNGEILFLEKDGSKNSYIGTLKIPLANAVNSTDTPFTDETFRTFVAENLGK